ncbi:hypothetical protein GUJ93_ZPchr0009g1737 [Zizania palustris]|uniref:Uncharacterized protein n=1 Tax=Zizania palustris TaxID=103762 RepID=A0A8J5RGG3_ZIZPA|nr:hypothetical protein GUJ93_ZPchr0009g1737 [Zizania palustris]
MARGPTTWRSEAKNTGGHPPGRRPSEVAFREKVAGGRPPREGCRRPPSDGRLPEAALRERLPEVAFREKVAGGRPPGEGL